MPPETHYARSGDVYIAYQIIGAGLVDVVMAPGTVSHLDLDWESPPRAGFYEGLSRFCRLIRFDKRGTGLSDRPLQMATLEERADDIRAVMDAAGSQQAVIFGASEGASMACLFAATHPERTRSLMIWGAQACWVQSADYPWGMSSEDNTRMLRDVQEHWPSLEYVLGPGAGLGKDVDPAYLAFVLRYMRAAASPSAAAAYERMNSEIDIRPILPSIRVPALVMNRSGDPVAHVEAARALAAGIPGARFIEFPGNTHSMMTIEPERVLAEMEEFVTGERPAQNIERILATVLFIDIIESTQQAAARGDAAWRNRLAAYYALVRKELARFRGREIDTAGDSFFATFDGPARAVRCALAVVTGIRQMGMQVRAGLHTGECELIEEKVGGLAVHIGARVLAQAGPSEVWVTSTVRELVVGSGLTFLTRGPQLLKGVPGEWQLYAAQ